MVIVVELTLKMKRYGRQPNYLKGYKYTVDSQIEIEIAQISLPPLT